jgi:hypothetical protein
MKATVRNNRHVAVWIWAGVGVVLLVALFAGLTFSAEKRVDQFFVDHFRDHTSVGKKPEDFGNAGAYYSFVIGVPVALLGAIVGAVASVLFATYTTSRDEVTIFRFIEETIKPLSAQIQTLILSFNRMIFHGNRLFQVAEDLASAIVDSGPVESREEFEKVIEKAINSLAVDKQSALKDGFSSIRTEMSVWERIYEEFALDVYGSLFARERISAVLEDKRGTAISYLRSVVPTDLLDKISIGSAPEMSTNEKRAKEQQVSDSKDAYANDFREILDRLNSVHGMPEAQHVLRAYLNLPNGLTTLEFLGAAMYSPIFTLKTPRQTNLFNRNPTVYSFMFNVGAARLLTLYQYIPERTALVRALEKIFGGRSMVARNFLEVAGPSPRNFLMLRNDDAISWQLENFDRLIVVSTSEGPAFYDKAIHGPIPTAQALVDA